MEPNETEDEWPDDPDAWEVSDQAYRAKWEKEPDASEPMLAGDPDPFTPGPGYTPARASARTVSDSYVGGMSAAGPYLGLGVQIAASMALFAGGGYALDRWLGTSPWGILSGAMLGMLGIVALIVRVAKEADRETAARRKKKEAA